MTAVLGARLSVSEEVQTLLSISHLNKNLYTRSAMPQSMPESKHIIIFTMFHLQTA